MPADIPTSRGRQGPPRITLRRRLWLLVLLAALVALPVAAQAPSELITRYGLPGAPLNVAVESPQRIWTTLPESGKLALLTLASDGSHTVDAFTCGPGCEPYDIAVADGIVWFTDRAGGRLGRLNPAETSPTPTWYSPGWEGVLPTSLAVVPGATSTTVWFTDGSTGRLGRLVVGASTPDGAFTSYTLASEAARFQDLALQLPNEIWITDPGSGAIRTFVPWRGAFGVAQLTGPGSEPWSVAVVSGTAWFTDPATGRIGGVNANTMQDIRWISLPDPSSEPMDLVGLNSHIHFTERAASRLSRVSSRIFPYVQGLAVPGSAPSGLALDSEATVWAAATGTHELLRWPAPFFHRLALPLVYKNSHN